ncbi:MAG: TVP38/TMEM64 family protein [Firmicutes bacterium HGW-Firmicutes-15]|nr:MAG: TVP38/TMEM64 family protein [Firmicutes bacterium HGW-Firmicutes-15]
MHHLHNLKFFVEYVRSFGYLAPAVALIFFTVQAAVPVFPYAALVAMAVILFGFKIGFLISIVGATLGSVVCYWFCRKFGSEWFNRKILRRWGYNTNQINSGIAFWGIVLAHQVPVFPSAVIAATAALSQVSLWSFVVSTALGLIPATMVYGGVGFYIFRIHDIYKIMIILGIILLVMFLSKGIIKKKLAPTKTSSANEEV